jgi:hypothetical protein
MTKINPLYILALLALTFVLIVYSNGRLEKQIIETQVINGELEKSGKQIKNLKRNWDNKEQMSAKINTILSDPQLSKKVLDKNIKGDTYKISLGGLNDKETDILMDKLLNGFITINLLSIKSENDANVSVVMELEL